MRLDRVIAVRNTKTVYRDGDKCIKVFNGEYSKEDVLTEALNQARAEKMRIKVPEIYEVSRVDGKWAVISEFIKGKTIARLMAESPENADGYLELLVDLQLEVQREKCPLFESLSEKARRGISAAVGAGAERGLLRAQLLTPDEENCVCHGDFTPENILVSGDGVPYILDWANASRGNAAADAAGTYLMFRRNGDPAAERYIGIFCEKSGLDGAEIGGWMAFAAAAQYAAANERARRFLFSWLNRRDK
ncbi:MAG: aminoglycoside phosphotransferase family protein [Clostridiales bacterium]|nr:aminoglycoside phosphotransferase family protein [Clostridiales bacterium]